ncbi:hypothetical protein [Alloalcanivorax xenomutans]|uniref:WYL domain-containing protein n=1 Tax=Alloalcanivorax xenomutans TaxID=1094342 RepID=UPI003C695E9A
MAELIFTYKNSKGEITDRTVSNWREQGWYFTGFCVSKQKVATFRRDRILAFIEGESLLTPLAELPDEKPPLQSGKPRKTKGIEILFSGFSKDHRAQLEAQAKDSGMTVCKTVTQSLAYFCAGPNAGPVKMAKAAEKGCLVLDEAQLLRLWETGELPQDLID